MVERLTAAELRAMQEQPKVYEKVVADFDKWSIESGLVAVGAKGEPML